MSTGLALHTDMLVKLSLRDLQRHNGPQSPSLQLPVEWVDTSRKLQYCMSRRATLLTTEDTGMYLTKNHPTSPAGRMAAFELACSLLL